MEKLYKAGADSYVERDIDPKKAVGIWHHRYLAKEGLRTHNPEHLQGLHYYSQLAYVAGYDYVVLSDKRTNSGREEAVLITKHCVNKGVKLIASGYAPAPRKPYDNIAKICKGDMRIPTEEEPRFYKDLPELTVAPKAKDEPACLSTHEDEVLALIDCLTGTGNKAKALRAIARYLIKEAINIEQEEGEPK
jgi:hypothetical protein